ncbi:sigma-70 family RNA polymerase sigma factor [Aquibacillus sediminis]|uniref:sigma-70 family RNA polymerase sigma factor n=1 Tax=Aquibacillus sediminis TaxID=2574734 RepID=UPI001108700F|nr:sigma-70 family RNA polymerase sigma factor [Aquibacillus sediminis]
MVERNMNNFETIVKDYEKMIYRIIHKLGIRDTDHAFYQEGLIALWKAVEKYDPARGAFSSYAYFLIEKAMISLIRKNNHQIQQQHDYVTNLLVNNEDYCTYAEMGMDPYLLQSIRQQLTKKQWYWFSLFILKDLSIYEIAIQEDVTIDAVKNWARLAKPKLRNLLKDYHD